MLLSKSFFLCVLSGVKMTLKTQKFPENIQFEVLCTLLFLGQIVLCLKTNVLTMT